MRVLIALAALALTSIARADVMPPPEEVTDLQRQLVGVWQQDGLTGMLGHGEPLETMFFDKERYTVVAYNAMPSSGIYGFGEYGGPYMAERISDSEIKVTITMGTPTPGATLPTRELTFRFDAPDHVTIHRRGRGEADVGYTRIHPKTAN